MLRRNTDPRVGRVWRRGVLIAIVAGGAVLITLLVVHPLGIPAWFWAFWLVVYMPFTLVAAAVLKYFVLLLQRPSRPA